MSFEENYDPDEDLPDWLKDLNNDSSDQADDTVIPSDTEAEDTSDELGNTMDETSETSESASDNSAAEYLQGSFKDDTEEWLASIREQQGIIKKNEPKEEEVESVDILNRIQELKNKDQGLSEEEPQVWLDNLANEAEIADENAEFLDTSNIEDTNIDWLSGISNEKTPPLPSEPDIDRLDTPDIENDPDLELPDWLKKIQDGEDLSGLEEPLNNEEDQINEDSGETGDWIKKFTGTLDPAVLDSKMEFKLEEDLAWINEQDIPSETTNESESDLDNTQETAVSKDPNWLSSMEENSLPDSEIEMPDFTIEEIPVDENEARKYQLEDFKMDTDEIPDWLGSSDPQSESLKEDGELPPSDLEETIAPADMPTWLQAMRPEGADGPLGLEIDKTSKDIEITGPLAGLENILPAESGDTLFGTHLVPRVNLYVSKTQQSHIALLQQMIIDEEEAPPVKRRTLEIPQQIFRWLIAGLLYLAVLLPVFTHQSKTPLPSNTHPEISSMAEIINALPPNSPILVAFEYQPGLSGEMEAASAAVLDHLLIRGAELAFISTSPTGPGLIEHYLDTILLNHAYIADRKYPNLGFISGGSAGLLNFASNPRNTVPIVNMHDAEGNGINGWEVKPLNQINQISDFALILVITDDPDTARAWIEQVQPYLIDKSNTELSVPMVMVVSAQAEPLVYPYYDNTPKQVSGLVSGLSGGATYETFNVRENIASRYWDGFSSGISITVIIIIIGGLFNLVQGWRKTRKRSDNEE